EYLPSAERNGAPRHRPSGASPERPSPRTERRMAERSPSGARAWPAPEHVGQGRMRAEPRHQAALAVASGLTATHAFNADDAHRKLAERTSADAHRPSPKVRRSRLSRNVSRNSPFGVGKLGRRIIHTSFAKDADQLFDPNLGGSSPLKAAPRPA